MTTLLVFARSANRRLELRGSKVDFFVIQLRLELGAQRLQTAVRSFVARESTFCSTSVVRKRPSGARCSASGAEEEEGEEEGEDEGEDEDEEKVEANVEEEESRKRRRKRSRRRRRRRRSGRRRGGRRRGGKR